MWISTNPKIAGITEDSVAANKAQMMIASSHFEEARDTVLGRCSMCHTEEPVYEGLYQAPKDVILDNDVAIASYAREIYLQAGRSHAMPPGNVTYMTPEERQLLVNWYHDATKG